MNVKNCINKSSVYIPNNKKSLQFWFRFLDLLPRINNGRKMTVYVGLLYAIKRFLESGEKIPEDFKIEDFK